MAIKGMTDTVTAHFPRLGILRKGDKRTAEDIAKKRPGRDLEFFRFVNEQRADIENAFRAAYGLEPKRLHFYFLYDKIDQIWEAWLEEHGASGLIMRSNGEEMHLWRDQNGRMSKERRPDPYFTGEKTLNEDEPELKATGRLSIVLPELLAAGYIGDVVLTTTSKHDILSIQACLNEIAENRARHGLGLRGIEFVMERVHRKISCPDKRQPGKRVRRIKSLVIIYPAQEWVMAQLENAKREQYQLTAGADLEIDDETPEPGDWAYDDYTDGEYTGAAEDPDAAGDLSEPETDATPDAAEIARQQILTLATTRYATRTGPASHKQIGLIVSQMDEITGSSDNRRAVLKHIFGAESTTKITAAEAAALLAYILEPSKPGSEAYTVRPEAAEEIRQMVRAALINAGQTELEL